MKKALFIRTLIFGTFAFSSISNAESYLSGYVGVAIPHDSDFRNNAGTGASGTISFNDGGAVGAKVGHWFNDTNAPYFGLELDANGRFPSTDKMTISGVNFDINSDITVFSLTADALLRYPSGNIRPYAGIGGGWFHGTFGNGVLSFRGSPILTFNGTSDDTFGGQVLAGVDFLINPNLSVFGEYKYSFANFSFHGGVGGVNDDVDYRESQLLIGLAYHF